MTQPSSAPRNVGILTLGVAVAAAFLVGLYVGTLLPAYEQATVTKRPLAQGTAPTIEGENPNAHAAENAKILQLEQFVAKNPNDLGTWIQLGNLYYDTHQFKSAIRSYEKALVLKSDDADVLTDLGTMYRLDSQAEKALEAYSRALVINPKHEHAAFNKGVVLAFDLNRKEEAKAVWKQLLTHSPQVSAPDGTPLDTLLKQLD